MKIVDIAHPPVQVYAVGQEEFVTARLLNAGPVEKFKNAAGQYVVARAAAQAAPGETAALQKQTAPVLETRAGAFTYEPWQFSNGQRTEMRHATQLSQEMGEDVRYYLGTWVARPVYMERPTHTPARLIVARRRLYRALGLAVVGVAPWTPEVPEA